MRLTVLIGLAGLAGLSVWAFLPLSSYLHKQSTGQLEHPATESTPHKQTSLDRGAFELSLWNPRPLETTESRETVAETPPPRPMPFEVQLVGIITNKNSYRAALYIKTKKKLITVTVGDRVGEHTVTRISPGEVEFTDGEHTQTLVIREDREDTS